MYSWVKESEDFRLPEGVGFKIGRNTEFKFIVVQVHYINPLSEPDDSGLIFNVTTAPLTKQAELAVMGNGASVPAERTTIEDSSCFLSSSATVYPFAYRTHAHNLGVVISGYHVTDNHTWDLIGKADPRLPQTFKPVENPKMEIKEEDAIAARCVFVSNRTHETLIGPTGNDEMCNYFLMFYTEGKGPVRWSGDCYADGQFKWRDHFANVPEREANTIDGDYYEGDYREQGQY